MIQVPGCRLLIKPLKIEENDRVFRAAKAAGIELPELSERKIQSNIDKGTVLQIGPTASQDYVEGLRVGDTIGFTKFGGKFVRDLDSDEDLLVINDEDCIVIFKENK